MKKGDIVTIKDSSYSQSIINEKTAHEILDDRYGGISKQYVVVEVNCMFPTTVMHQPDSCYNNTVIQDIESGKVVFIMERFLQPATHTIVIDGKTIELSHESYKNLKEQLA